jgi:GNAT superfamily N-acetyltransferase
VSRPVTLRRLAPSEVALHRELRLRALLDSPDSFGETYGAAAAQPLGHWETLTRSVTEPSPQVMLLACAGDDVVGSAYGLLDRTRADAGRVGGMWVAPAWRRRGVGRALLEGVIDWARERGLGPLGLWAPAHSPAAIALYTGAGFRETGERRSLPTNPSRWIVAMERQSSR